MKKQRLLKLADLLEALPRKRFNYATWASGWDGESSLNECGTAACALGWATTIPTLKLKLVRLLSTDVVVQNEEGAVGIGAAKKAFGLEYQQASFLFVPCAYGSRLSANATPKRVAKHIRKFVEAGGIYVV